MLGVFHTNTTLRQPLARSPVRLSVMADALSVERVFKHARGEGRAACEDGGEKPRERMSELRRPRDVDDFIQPDVNGSVSHASTLRSACH